MMTFPHMHTQGRDNQRTHPALKMGFTSVTSSAGGGLVGDWGVGTEQWRVGRIRLYRGNIDLQAVLV